jgi:metal-dependent amidase/aminoacylase/carboxypeptidase family protein
MGGTCEVNIMKGYPFLVNDAISSAIIFASTLRNTLVAENIVELDLSMTAEDFAWYSHQIPACFLSPGYPQ